MGGGGGGERVSDDAMAKREAVVVVDGWFSFSSLVSLSRARSALSATPTPLGGEDSVSSAVP